MSNKEKVIVAYFIKAQRPIDIAKHFNISKSAVTQILSKDNRYEEEKEKRKEYNRMKHREDTKKYIKEKRQKEYEELMIVKKQHFQASNELSKFNTLNNIQYKKYNSSAYDYDKKLKVYKFNSKLGKSIDIPKFIKI